VLAFELPKQVVFSGVVTGATYGIMAVGIILIYRSTRVINLAIAEMGGLSAALLARMVINWDLAYWLAFVICVLVGRVITTGWTRRRAQPPHIVFVARSVSRSSWCRPGGAGNQFIRTFPRPERPGRSAVSWCAANTLSSSSSCRCSPPLSRYSSTAPRASRRVGGESRWPVRRINAKGMSTLVGARGLLAAIATIAGADHDHDVGRYRHTRSGPPYALVAVVIAR
jgi:hypothetical protein